MTESSVYPMTRLEDVDRYTEEEFMELAPEKPKAELIDGVMEMSTPATVIHEVFQGFLFTVLKFFVEIKNLGIVLGPNAPVRIAPENIYSPDILFVSEARRPIITPREVNGVPDFVIELLSASTAYLDRGRKRQAYEQAGLGELWLIDPYGPLGTRFYQRRDERLIEIEPLGEQIRSLAVPGFFLRLRWLWPESGQGPIPTVEALRQIEVF